MSSEGPSAPLLLRNARLLGRDEPVDIRVSQGRVARIAPVLAGAGESVDLDGRVVVPGLWDSHVHLAQWAMRRRRVEVSGAASAAETIEILRRAALAAPPASGTVLVGFGFRDGLWPDAPSREALDDVGVPTAIISGDVHCVWSNRAALARLGLGEEDWLLREEPAFRLGRRLGELSESEGDEEVAEAIRVAAGRGVVGIVDLEMTDAGAAWARRRARVGFPRLRVRAGVYPHDLEAARRRGQRTGETVAGTEGLVVGGPLKLFTDGALNTRTAWVEEPYAGLEEPGLDRTGVAVQSSAELEALIRTGLDAGMTPAVHAIGDAAVRQALDAMAATASGGSIEHAQLVRHDDLPRFAALGVTASLQPEHALDDRDVTDRFWPGRGARVIPARALLDAGASLALGSDAPVAPLDPWITICAAVFRARDERAAWHPEQRITLAEALEASVRSRVAVGEAADLVVLNGDPARAERDGDTAALRSMPVAGTLLGGDWIHRTF